jgi:hypothetical protein
MGRWFIWTRDVTFDHEGRFAGVAAAGQHSTGFRMREVG